MDTLTGLSAEALADECGALSQKKKHIEEQIEARKSEIVRRGLDYIRGSSFILTLSETTSKRVDLDAMRKDPKIAKIIGKFEKPSKSLRMTVKSVPLVVEGDVE